MISHLNDCARANNFVRPIKIKNLKKPLFNQYRGFFYGTIVEIHFGKGKLCFIKKLDQHTF